MKNNILKIILNLEINKQPFKNYTQKPKTKIIFMITNAEIKDCQ